MRVQDEAADALTPFNLGDKVFGKLRQEAAKITDPTMRLRWLEDVLGPEVIEIFALGLLLQEPSHLFAGDIGKDDRSGLAVVARTAEFIAADAKRAATITRAIARGQWSKLVPQFSGFGNAAPQASAAAVILLFLPACATDAFAARVVHRLPPTSSKLRLSPASFSSSPGWVAIVDPDKATVDQLQRFAAHTVLSWLREPKRFAFGMEHAPNRKRTERFGKVLEGIAREPESLAEVLSHARSGAWSKADDAASSWHRARSVEYGDTMTSPPALADFLLAALIPGCHLRDLTTLLKAQTKA
ncbi:MAG TPA: hypothetical protein VG889_01075 [Rhizomicrobium sp.]|nr:hypothetical protein [Rhizomicrobium sp.]